MARLPISEIVQEWCNDHNAMTGAYRWFLALWLGTLLGCIGLMMTWTTSYFWLVVAAVAAAFLWWFMFAPKPIRYGQLRTSHRGVFVEDSLLARLADAKEVPEWVKSAIANELENHHNITFAALFDIEGWIETEAARARAEQLVERIQRRPGFQKMVAFSQKSGDR